MFWFGIFQHILEITRPISNVYTTEFKSTCLKLMAIVSDKRFMHCDGNDSYIVASTYLKNDKSIFFFTYIYSMNQQV